MPARFKIRFALAMSARSYAEELIPLEADQPKAYDRRYAQVHMTEAELVRDIESVLDRVQSGTEILIERNAKPVAVLRPAQSNRRKLSEIVASLSEQSTATIDPDFAADVKSFMDRYREPLHPPEWD